MVHGDSLNWHTLRNMLSDVLSIFVGNGNGDCLSRRNSIVALNLLNLRELLDALDRLHSRLDKINWVGAWRVVMRLLAIVPDWNRCHGDTIHGRLLFRVGLAVLIGSLSARRIIVDSQVSCQLV